MCVEYPDHLVIDLRRLVGRQCIGDLAVGIFADELLELSLQSGQLCLGRGHGIVVSVERGLLGKWGPNHAADPVVTRWMPGTEALPARERVLQVSTSRPPCTSHLAYLTC